MKTELAEDINYSNQEYNVNSFFKEKYHDKKHPTKEKLAQFLKRLQQLLHSLHKGTYQHNLGMEHTIITIQNFTESHNHRII